MLFKAVKALALLVLVTVSGLIAAFSLSPWPGALLIRASFQKGAADAAELIAPLVPAEVETRTLRYDPQDPDGWLDLYRAPGTAADAPLVVWIHGGGFVSGDRQEGANYLKILASQGFVVASLDYTVAPEAHYPVPVRQVLTAVDYLFREGAALQVNTGRMFLAGDSAGAQIAAQAAAVLTYADYADEVGVRAGPSTPEQPFAGLVLYCGAYDLIGLAGEGSGILSWFVKTVGWAYSGRRDWAEAPQMASTNLLPVLTADYPPVFISAGNADPLEPQSRRLAATLQAAGADVESLFFVADHIPALGHEYQVDLTSEAGQLALSRMTDWIIRP